ncbi:hypothetical protein PA08_2753 [Cutibacterium modestum P08]|uniref:Uncharacterized protein n=1 Tax=Cutibacterium modestum HL044PA1 TaxID=765109 RepID=A0ABP2K9G7_9ACTN|nr:hypothetical protein HMPREF9607_00239 [Cutibacterium modestum HL044PA1]EGG25464.1 hypothetical protein PA08_2753 [Cutibacterium modestum P08]
MGDVLKHLGTTARQLIIDALEATYGRDNIANRADGTVRLRPPRHQWRAHRSQLNCK